MTLKPIQVPEKVKQSPLEKKKKSKKKSKKKHEIFY